EPYLIRLGFITRTPRGRMLLPGAYEHMGWPVPEDAGNTQLNF
ncbi:MAG: Holliday junction branch migration DNA helicase RuvB, partial [Clostridia bacterium]|nr:Holliday junction branch migration DNA helicase RuvB [Clostridia bacterium]